MKYFILFIFLSSFNATYSYCEDCKRLQSNLIDIFQTEQNKIYSITNILCNVGGSVKLCRYFVYSLGKLLLSKKKDFLERTNYICANVFNFCPLTYQAFDFVEFKKQIYDQYPPIQKTHNIENVKPFRALVLTDVHVQTDYAYKSKVHCNDPAGCCYKNDTPDGPEDEAGYWGQYGCDIPRRTLEESIKSMKEKPTEFMFLLGDNYAHGYFRDNGPDKLWEANKYFYEQIEKNFKDRIVIPALGNHESDPVDFFDFDDKQNNVIKNVYSQFEKFIPKEKIQNLIDNGFYDLEFKQHNLKVISLNSQLGDNKNAYNVDHNTNTLNFTHKLSQSLYESEKKGQKVIIISHIAVKSGSLVQDYTRAYQIIVERFKDTITSLISGHTHNDTLQFIKNDDGEYIHCNFIVSSLTTAQNYNPSFRIFEFDENTKFKNYTHYRTDIDFYNKKYDQSGKPVLTFDPIYKFKEEYGITNWNSKEDYMQFLARFNKDETLQMKYISNIKNQYINPEWREKLLQAKCGLIAQSAGEELTCNGQINFNYFFFFFMHPWIEIIRKQ